MTIQEMREAKKAKLAEARALHESHIGKEMPEDVKAQYDSLKSEAKQYEASIQEQIDLDGLQDVTRDEQTLPTAHGIEVKHKPVYKNIGEQLLDIKAMETGSGDAPAAAERFQKVVNESGLSTGKDSDGAYLIETDKSTAILQTSVQTGVLSSRCTSQPIGANADSFEYFAADDRDRSAGTFLGGVKAYRKAETETMSKWVTAAINPREIKLEDQYALLKVSDRMLQDNVALTGLVKNAVPRAFAFLDDKEIFEGTGAGQRLGIMNSDVKITIAKESGQANTTIVAENCVKMLARFYGSLSSAAWFINRDCFPSLAFMTVGDNKYPVFIPGGSLANAPYGTLLGLPIIPIEHCETLGTEGDIVLGDFSQYLLVSKGQTEEAESIHVRFLTNEKVFRWVKRNNGQPMHDEPITPLKGSNTLSPFVTLADRKS